MKDNFRKKYAGKISLILFSVIAIGTVVSLMATLLGVIGAFDRLEDTALEAAFLKRPPLITDPAVMSIDIDDQAIETLGRWPWPLYRHKSLVDLLKLYKSRAIIFTDIDISKAAHNAMEESAAGLLKDMIKNAYESGNAASTMSYIDSGNSDDGFFRSLKDYGQVFYTVKSTQTGQISPSLTADPRLRLLNNKIAIPGPSHGAPQTGELSLPSESIVGTIRGGGFNSIVMDKEGIVFRYPMITSFNDTLYPSLPLGAAIKLMNADNVTVTQGKSIKLEFAKAGSATIPIDKEGQVLVNWAGRYKDTFQRVPFGIAASFIVFQEAKNALRKYDLKTMPDPRSALDQLMKELQKHHYAAKDQSDDIANMVYIATLIENRLNSTGSTVKDALNSLELEPTGKLMEIGNQIKFNNYLLQKYDETEKLPVYEEAVKELAYTPKEAEEAALKDAYDLIKFHLENETIPLVRPLYFDKSETDVNGKVRGITPLILKDKIIFYGLTATGLTSQNPTPFMERHPMLDLPINVLNSILTGKFLHEPPTLLIYAITYALAYFIVVFVVLMAPVRSGVITVFSAGAYLTLSWYLFTSRGIIMPVSQPLFAIFSAYLGGVIYRYFKERNERKKVRQMFSTMVSPEILKIIEKTPGKLNLGGELKRATMFSSDVSGFTTISEGVTSRELADILNIYLTPMSNIIMCYDGYVDKYEGDAIKADFGVPLSDAGHAWKACWSALYQQEELLAVQRMILLQYGVRITARMGVNTGTVLAGNMGSEGHIQYTAMGPAATVAEELEPANKIFDTWIMIGHDTYEDAKDYVAARHLGEIKTHHGTDAVYELAGWTKEKFLSYWQQRPIPELVIKSFKKLRPEKILGYNYYFTNKALPELPILTEIRQMFSELAELSVQYMQIKDIIHIINIEDSIHELQRKLRSHVAIYEQEEMPMKIRNEITKLHGALEDESTPYEAVLLSWKITLKHQMAHIIALTGKIGKAETETFVDMADKLEKGIESINKRINCAGDETSSSLSDNLKDLLLIEDMGSSMIVDKLTYQCMSIEKVISVRLNKFADGLRGNPQQYHELIAGMCTVDEERLKMFRQFEDGLSLYKQRRWDAALEAFKQCLNSAPGDGPSKKYIEEIERLKTTPPPEDWTGAWETG
ncbi:MAG: CHASE2 domain-containing protein [Nitrospirae bacterium]|nr:CHASE2 domain-containing protein [Nitrospirota bacterium]